MNPSKPFILRPIATSLLMAGILLMGGFAYRFLPVSALPQVDYPTIQVATFYPGASPEVVATAISAPLERQFGQLPGLKRMFSASSAGSSLMTLQFDLDLNIDVAVQQVQASINAAGTFLPSDLPNPPIYSKSNPADPPILSLGLTSLSLPLTRVQDYADSRLAQKISQMPGVGLVSLSGGQKPAVRIQANPRQLSSYGLTMADIRQAVTLSNVNQAKGSFDGMRQAFSIGANDQLLTSGQYKSVIIAYRNNSPVYLSDVATVIDDAENVKQAAWMNATPSVILNIQRQPGANIIAVVDRVKSMLPQLTASLPSSVDVKILTDRTTTIRASVKAVEFELMLCIALVVMIIFVFLRTLAATVIPSVAVPLSIVGTFGLMYALGFSLNNLTLMALTISTGFVVDDAIVMIENIMRYIEDGDKPLQAALKGSEQIAFTIMSLTVALVAVLIPLLFMGDVVGRLFREFAVTLSVAILISAFVSLTLTPMMCSKILKHKPPEEQNRFYKASERVFQNIVGFYARTLKWVLRHQGATLGVAIATLGTTVLLYIVVPKGFFPVQDTGVIIGITEASPQSISFDAMAIRQQEVAKVILRDPAVESLSSFIGIDGINTTLNSGRIQINLKPLAERRDNVSDIIRRIRADMAGVRGIELFMQPVQDLTVDDKVSRNQYQFVLEDADPRVLGRYVPMLVERLQEIPILRDVASDLQNSGLQANVLLDRTTASRLGITPQILDDALYDAFGQRQISTMFTQMNQYKVVLEAHPGMVNKPEDLLGLYVRSDTGQIVPLSAFTRVETGFAPLSINHQDQFPCATVSFNLAPGASLGAAVKEIEKAFYNLDAPASFKGSFEGTAQALGSALANTPWLILAAILTVYILLGVLYESYIHPITILSTLPSAGVGALLSLMICRTDFTIIALIGIVLLMGLVAKNAIIMIDFALEAERQGHMEAENAIFQAAVLRFRPILMTTMAALLSGLPLALSTGVGSELRKPLGICMVGGLIFSQVLTLYTTPVIYLAFERLAERARKRFGPPKTPGGIPSDPLDGAEPIAAEEA